MGLPRHYLDNDNPATCPVCGSRTNFTVNSDGTQDHSCPSTSCGYIFKGEFDETPDEFRSRVEASTVDPEDHDYQGDGTSRCTVCLGTMNEHVSIGPVVWP